MEFEKIPRVYPTLACNYRCSYCVNPKPKHRIISGEQWIDILNGWPGDSVILTGGEPTLHPDFVQIINGLNKQKICVYSNMSWKESLLDRLQKKIYIYASFHPNQKDSAEDIAKRAKYLIKSGHNLIDIHINKACLEYKKYQRIFQNYGLQLIFEEDQYKSPNYKKMLHGTKVVCKVPRILLGPDGLRYICVTKMAHADESGLIRHKNIPAVSSCQIHGQCSPCDVVHRTVRPLEHANPIYNRIKKLARILGRLKNS